MYVVNLLSLRIFLTRTEQLNLHSQRERWHLPLVGVFLKKLLKKKNKTKKLITEGFQKKNSNKEDNQVSFQTWARVPLVNLLQYKFDQAHLSIETVLYPSLVSMEPLSRGVFKSIFFNSGLVGTN